jgi:predicted O-linked N-acetylglucosamine transferase (SPINDLY family)
MMNRIQSLLQDAFSFFNCGEFQAAKDLLKKILDLDPNNFDALFGIGVIEGIGKNFDQALVYFNRAKHIHPENQDLLFNIAKTHSDLNKHEVAINGYDNVLSINDGHIQSWLGKGFSLSQSERYLDSINCFLMGLKIAPNSLEAHVSLSMLYSKLNQYENSLYHGRSALKIDENSFEAHVNIAIALHRMKLHRQAIDHFNKALQLRNKSDLIFGDLVRCKMEICDWSSYQADKEIIKAGILQENLICQPLTFIGLFDNPLLEFQCSKVYSQNKFPEFNKKYIGAHKKSAEEKIKIGYYSSDFYNHATSYLIVGLIENHNKDQFEIHGFSLGLPIEDEMSLRISRAFTSFHLVNNLSPGEISNLSKEIGIDIAIDLKGFTNGSRTTIFSHRIAPIQINFLGYPGTMATEYFDYVIADPHVITVATKNFYSEKVIFLPNSFQPNDSKKSISTENVKRSDHQLPNNSFVFCSFNNNYKITPEIFTTWMDILITVQNSVLWLYEDNPFVVENLRCEAVKKNVSADRIIFAPKLPLAEHLGRHQLADLFLDTYPCNAHTTASDALWAQLPVLTLRGNSFSSRVASSLLHNLDLDELIADSIDEYKNIAIRLALNQERLHVLKDKLSKAIDSSPLFNTEKYTRSIENAFTLAHQRLASQMPPIDIYA